jgi:hypothetical protein
MRLYKQMIAAEGKVIQKHFFALLPITIEGETKWLEMVGVEFCKERVFDYNCPVACSWLEWVPKRFVRADPFGYVYYRRYLNEIKYGENKLVGFLLRRLSLMIWGRCDDCQAIRQMNGRCPHAKEPMPSAEGGGK